MDVIIQKYYDDLINSFDFATSISPDVKDKDVQYRILSISYNTSKINGLEKKLGLPQKDLFLTLFVFNLVKFSFSKDILIGYNKQAAGYHFNTDLSVEEYIEDFKFQFKDYPEVDDLDFESEILFATEDYKRKIISLFFHLGMMKYLWNMIPHIIPMN